MLTLLNRSKLPDNLLKPLLSKACKFGGLLLTPPLLITVNQGESLHGYARRGCRVYKNKKWYRSAGGFINVTLGAWKEGWLVIDHVSWVMRLFDLAVHEAAHVKDYRDPSRPEFTSRRCWGKRRPNWSDRPEEIRAEEAVQDFEENIGYEVISEEILNLAIWLEDNQEKDKDAPTEKALEDPYQFTRQQVGIIGNAIYEVMVRLSEADGGDFDFKKADLPKYNHSFRLVSVTNAEAVTELMYQIDLFEEFGDISKYQYKIIYDKLLTIYRKLEWGVEFPLS